MPLKIEIPDSAVEATRKIVILTAREVYLRYTKAVDEWNTWQSLMQQMGVAMSDITSKKEDEPNGYKLSNFITTYETNIPSRYDPNSSWGNKARFILKTHPDGLSAKQIVDAMLQLEPKLDKKTALNSVPATLSVEARAGKFIREFNDGEYIYRVVPK